MAAATMGAAVLAQALKTQGVEYMFGVVGFPVIEFAGIAQANGIKYIGMRNEQAACYAASVIGYFTKRPAVCLTVPGPGLLHVIAGMQNANENGWPLIVISGSMDLDQDSMGAFQELNQVAVTRPFAKFTARPSSIEKIPFYVEKAVRISLYGRPGACYIDLPSDFIKKKVDSSKVLSIIRCPDPPGLRACPNQVKAAVNLLCSAQRPLVIIGKGAAYGGAENSIKNLLHRTKFPFLPTPMAKGLIPDDDELSVAPARSRALQEADVILLLAARLNWMLHFGKPPRFNPNVKIIQVDLFPEELHNNVQATVALQGDVDSVVKQISKELVKHHGSFNLSLDSTWWTTLRKKIEENSKATKELIAEASPPMNYYNSLFEVNEQLPRDCVVVAEGSNTMDIARTMIHSYLPRHRLDAGTYGTMGVGCGFAIAAALWCRDHHPKKRVVCIEGDSAFGFSGMEVETACRYGLPIIFVVINNNGIAMGVEEEEFKRIHREEDPRLSLIPTGLTPNSRYDTMIESFGGKGYLAKTREELREYFARCLKDEKSTSLINVIISPFAGKKPQEFFWLTSKI